MNIPNLPIGTFAALAAVGVAQAGASPSPSFPIPAPGWSESAAAPGIPLALVPLVPSTSSADEIDAFGAAKVLIYPQTELPIPESEVRFAVPGGVGASELYSSTATAPDSTAMPDAIDYDLPDRPVARVKSESEDDTAKPDKRDSRLMGDRNPTQTHWGAPRIPTAALDSNRAVGDSIPDKGAIAADRPHSQDNADSVGARVISNLDSLRERIRATRVGEPELPPLGEADTYLPEPAAPFQGYIWPARGILTSGYGWRWGRLHGGIDIAAPIGTPAIAAAGGVVAYAQWDDGGYGNLVEIQHPDGSFTRYAHLDRILVREGQPVEQGQIIAEIGNTGNSTGPHLHFELHPSGLEAVDPLAYLPGDGQYSATQSMIGQQVP